MGAWPITLFLVYGPQQVMAQEASTLAAIFPNYSRNSRHVAVIANQQIQQSIQQTNQSVSTVGHVQHAAESDCRSRHPDRGHATTSDDLASALINSNPGRFQPVSPSGYIRGINY